MQSDIAGQKAQPCVFQHAREHPQAESCDARSDAFSNLSPPRPRRVLGSRLSQQHHVPIHASNTVVLGKSPQVGKGASSAPLARAPPPPGWPPGAPYLQALRGRLPHLPAAGFGRGDTGETQWMRLGARGCSAALHLGSVSAGCASSSRPPPPGGRRGLQAGGGGAALSCRQLVGSAARRLSWRSCEKTAQLRLGPRAHSATAPSSSPTAAASGPARSEHARGRRPPDS